VLGLSGGIACYKAAELVRELVRAGATVQVVMTEAATAVHHAGDDAGAVQPAGRASQWDAREPNNMAHINLTREADAVSWRRPVPTSSPSWPRAGPTSCWLLCLARPIERCPLLLAPAMNREMWAHPATQRNVAQVRADGAVVLGPAAATRPAARPATAACSRPPSCATN
jgi:phosphopantothenoylcysteine decarboxylase / phosphopantothenate---cysteine ligase